MGKIYTKANVQNNNPATPVSAGTMAIFDNGIDAVDTKTQNLPTDGSFDPAVYALKSYVDQGLSEIPDPYVLPKATQTTLGGVKVDGITIIIDSNGRISAVGGGGGGSSIASVVYIDDAGTYYTSDNVEGALQEIGAILANKVDKVTGKGLSAEDFTSSLKSKLEGIEAEANKYILPVATPSVIGGVKPDGTTITVDANGVISSVGGSGGSSAAQDITIVDAGSHYTSENVEGALQESGSKISILQGVEKLYQQNLVYNGDFSEGVLGWTSSNATITPSSGRCAILVSNQYGDLRKAIPSVTGRVYYIAATIEGTTDNYFGIAGSGVSLNASGTERISRNYTAPGTSFIIAAGDKRTSGFTTFYADNIVVLDLTSIFGQGSEPTASNIDSMLALFTNSWTDVSSKNRSSYDEKIVKKNWIINGGFDVWQRGTSQTSDNYGSDDRWYNYHSGSTKTHSRQLFTIGQIVVPNNPTYFSRTVVTSANTAACSVEKRQRIEDVVKWSGKTLTLSFWAKADANKNISIEFLQNFGTGGSANVQEIEVQKFAVTSSWQRFTKTVSIPSVAGKTVGANNFLQLTFWFDAGSNFNTRTNSLGNQSGTFDIANVSLVEGTVPVEWQTEAYADVLRQCQRYYQRWGDVIGNPRFSIALTITSTTAVMYVQPNVPFRIAPTSVEWNSVVLWDGANVYTGSSLGVASSNYNGLIGIDFTSSDMTFGRTIVGLTYGGSHAYFALNAEL